MGAHGVSFHGMIDAAWIHEQRLGFTQGKKNWYEEVQKSPLDGFTLGMFLKASAGRELFTRIDVVLNQGHDITEVIQHFTEPARIDSLSRSSSVADNLIEDIREEFKRELRRAFEESQKTKRPA